jgi:hypothetical protein
MDGGISEIIVRPGLINLILSMLVVLCRVLDSLIGNGTGSGQGPLDAPMDKAREVDTTTKVISFTTMFVKCM